MKIINALVFDGNGFTKKEINIKGEYISEASSDGQTIDAAGLMAIPGFVDIHFHGAVGYDFCDGSIEGLKAIADYEAKNGVMAICPATMTYKEEKLSQIMEIAFEFSNMRQNRTATLCGINMEGPFISSEKLGAQNPDYVMSPSVMMYKRLQEKSGNLIKLVDIAPETEGAFEFIEAVHDEVSVSIAHTCADYDTAIKAFNSGANHVTHLFNAMPGINHRNPGPIIAAKECGANVELICDGIHIHPAVVRFTFDYFSDDKVIIISDSMEGTGLSDGKYDLGGQTVIKEGRRAYLAEDEKTIAGSVSNLYECFTIAVREMGIPLTSAIKAVSINPAKAIGIDQSYGSIDIGKFANIILIDDSLIIKGLIVKGQQISAPEDEGRQLLGNPR